MGRNPKLLLDPHRIPDWYRFQHGSLPGWDVDAVMEHYGALIFGGFGERDAGALRPLKAQTHCRRGRRKSSSARTCGL